MTMNFFLGCVPRNLASPWDQTVISLNHSHTITKIKRLYPLVYLAKDGVRPSNLASLVRRTTFVALISPTCLCIWYLPAILIVFDAVRKGNLAFPPFILSSVLYISVATPCPYNLYILFYHYPVFHSWTYFRNKQWNKVDSRLHVANSGLGADKNSQSFVLGWLLRIILECRLIGVRVFMGYDV
jgi:hypothetical protein